MLNVRLRYSGRLPESPRAVTNARSPSLLSGLLRDENGGRLVPNHACKMGKRYRYYVSAPDDDDFARDGWRLPAKEIEATVINGVVNLLQDRLRLMKELDLTGQAPDQIKRLIREAENLGTGLLGAGRVAQLKSGEFGTISAIARSHKTDGENATRSIQLTFLAPDIVKAILEGRQPPELTAFHLKRVRNLPLSWDEQRKVLGFCG